jgi:hypothetical protein
VPGPDGRKVAAIERQDTTHVESLGESDDARIGEIQVEIGILVEQSGFRKDDLRNDQRLVQGFGHATDACPRGCARGRLITITLWPCCGAMV